MRVSTFIAGSAAFLAASVSAAANVSITTWPTALPSSVVDQFTSVEVALISSITGQPLFTSLESALPSISGAPTAIDPNNYVSLVSLVNSVLATPTWLSQLPTDQQSFVLSFATQQASLVNSAVAAGSGVTTGLVQIPSVAPTITINSTSAGTSLIDGSGLGATKAFGAVVAAVVFAFAMM